MNIIASTVAGESWNADSIYFNDFIDPLFYNCLCDAGINRGGRA